LLLERNQQVTTLAVSKQLTGMELTTQARQLPAVSISMSYVPAYLKLLDGCLF